MKNLDWSWMKMGVTYWRTAAFMAWWICCNVALFMLGFLEQRNDPGLQLMNRAIGTSLLISRGAGLCLLFHGILILLPMCRNILATLRQVRWMRRIVTFDKNIHFHKIVGWTMLVFTIVHVVAHFFNFLAMERASTSVTAFNLLWTHPAGITGTIMLFCMFLMYTSALKPIRERCFELFWYTHHLAFPFMLALCLHPIGCLIKKTNGQCKTYGTWQVILVCVTLYGFERLLRVYRSRRLTYITKVVQHPGNTVEIQFKLPTLSSTLPGQYVFINIPEISAHQWHPFTLTSAPEEAMASIHMRIVGDWTRAVANRLGYYSHTLSKDELPVIHVDGPFGTPSQEVFDHETLVLIGAGIGVTPFASILKSLWFRHQVSVEKKLLKTKRVHFFWICREPDAFSWFQSLLEALEHDKITDGFLTMHIYLTGKLAHHEQSNILLQENPSSDPVTNLQCLTKFGRPNFEVFLRNLRDELPSTASREIGVFFCGPVPLRANLKKMCMNLSTQDAVFRFKAEKFC